MGQDSRENKKQKPPLLPSLSNDGKAPAHPQKGLKNMAHCRHRWPPDLTSYSRYQEMKPPTYKQ